MKNKNMKSKIGLFIVILSLMFIVACTGTTVQTKYFVGTDGLKLEFIKANPKTVFEDEQFTLSMYVRNLGSYTVPTTTPGKLTASYNEYYLAADVDSLIPKKLILHAKDRDYPSGDEEYYEFVFDAKNISTLRDLPKTSIDFSLCYPYRTEVSIATCIDTQMTSSDQKAAACKSTTYTNAVGQGAPLMITKIVPEMLPQKDKIRPQFKIYIQNKGNGYVINKDPTTKAIDEVCGTERNRPDTADFNKITVKAVLSKMQLECIPNELKLVNEESFVRCYVKDADIGEFSRVERNYVSPLTITLDYGYYEIQHHEVEIQRRESTAGAGTEPQEECSAYMTYDSVSRQCVSLCSYCSNSAHFSEEKCQKNKPTDAFAFTSNFGCLCLKQECDKLRPNGDCILGYCPGSSYCCNKEKTTTATQQQQAALSDCTGKADGTECTDNHICVSNKCSSTETKCSYQKAKDGFACMDKTACDGTIAYIAGLCPGTVNNVCCVKNICDNKAYGDYCGYGLVCNQYKQCTTSYCDYSAKTNSAFSGYSCNAPSGCQSGTEKVTDVNNKRYCPMNGYVCCTPKAS